MIQVLGVACAAAVLGVSGWVAFAHGHGQCISLPSPFLLFGSSAAQ